MTERSILYSLKKIEAAKSSNHSLETLLRLYHLNLNILKFLSVQMNALDSTDELKPKRMVEQLVRHLEENVYLKACISKKNLKTLKPWLTEMDVYFKILKKKEPTTTRQLISDSEKILAILKISASKLLAAEKR